MPKKYERETPEGWLQRLKSGRYKRLGDVRKGLVRVRGWKKADKERAEFLAKSYFTNPAMMMHEPFYPSTGTQVAFTPPAPSPAKTLARTIVPASAQAASKKSTPGPTAAPTKTQLEKTKIIVDSAKSAIETFNTTVVDFDKGSAEVYMENLNRVGRYHSTVLDELGIPKLSAAGRIRENNQAGAKPAMVPEVLTQTVGGRTVVLSDSDLEALQAMREMQKSGLSGTIPAAEAEKNARTPIDPARFKVQHQ